MQEALPPSLEAAVGQLLGRLPVKDFDEASLVLLYQAHLAMDAVQRGASAATCAASAC